MGLDRNKELVRRFYAEAINQRDRTACERLLTEDFTHDGEVKGRAGQQEVVNAFLDAFSDLRNEILMLVAEGDLVAAHQRWTGTQDGEFMGMPTTGRKVEFTSTAIIRIEDGLVAEAWDEVDLFGLSAQLKPE
ncbi:MAG: ester cyclase [Solirubrobacterales bacterium]|nr:ester cyclase [Solirubrobacterales bacterium]MCB0860600.1 ester cyclase [Solirubrobacterales bacterium]HRV60355.1 ester cyclase [Solirubrobacterales bacterium]